MDNNILCLLASGILAFSLLYTKSEKKNQSKINKLSNHNLHSHLDNILENIHTNSFDSELEIEIKKKPKKKKSKINQSQLHQLIDDLDNKSDEVIDSIENNIIDSKQNNINDSIENNQNNDLKENNQNKTENNQELLSSRTNNQELLSSSTNNNESETDYLTNILDKSINTNINQLDEKNQYEEHNHILKIKNQIEKNIDYIINNSNFDILNIINNLKKDLYEATTLYDLKLILDFTNDIIKLLSYTSKNNQNNHNNHNTEIFDLEQNNLLLNRTFNK